ncbi:IucA/IucC family protein [Halobacillus sp. H74]|uniref:IucA/IucC family protein n=1 Tax=Halobacillus sp. H74 TaxID=3457436 RepID=UPI003FCD581F
MKSVREIAEDATMQSFLNCYLRETENFSEMPEERGAPWTEPVCDKTLRIPLDRQQMEVAVPVRYWSLTGRHLFAFPIYYRASEYGAWQVLDYVTMATLLVKEWLLGHGRNYSEDEMMLRVILSCQKIKDVVEHRREDQQELTKEDFDFIDAEQSLLFGHLLHPTPKSKQGLTAAEDWKYAPEYKGRFKLHYFSASRSLVNEESSLPLSASDIILENVKSSVGKVEIDEIIAGDHLLIPVHPLQVPRLLAKAEVQKLLSTGALKDLGELGPIYTATSSFRTLYSPDSRYMYKFSIPVKITNSLRVNQPKELDRGVEVARLLDTELGDDLNEKHPNFTIIKDPASINIPLDEEVSGFEVIIRENPFYDHSKQKSVVAALVQDNAYGDESRIHSIIQGIAKREGRSIEAVSVDWFDRYLTVSLDPVLWLFQQYGIALEAHQQNSIIQLKDGYPEHFYYRDNQGYYFCQSKSAKLASLLPDVNKTSDTICTDETAEERLRYYFFFNHLYGLINGFGTSRLVSEEKLMTILRERLKSHPSSSLITSLLENDKLPCKANLLTRLYDMDELVGPMESQSVYTNIDNPLAEKVASAHDL